MVKSAVLTERQYEMLKNAPKNELYGVYGDLSKQWWICFSRLDKYLGGFPSKEDAQFEISTNGYLNKEHKWYNGNTLVL